MPRLLLVSYVFPPQGGSGPLRRVKLIKYLNLLGWDVSVLTVTTVFTRQRDPSLGAEIPEGTRVIRARSFELSSLNPLLQRLRRRRGAGTGEQAVVPTDAGPTRLAHALQRWLFIPDREAG